MGAGDTIAGNIRAVKETAVGHKKIVAGSYPSALLDHLTDTENGIYINPPKGEALPIGMLAKRAPNAIFNAGEKMQFEHKSSSLEEAATTTLCEIQVDVIHQDLNEGDVIQKTLTVADQELTGDVTSSTSSWVKFFEYTVPDRTVIALSGSFNATLLEKA